MSVTWDGVTAGRGIGSGEIVFSLNGRGVRAQTTEAAGMLPDYFWRTREKVLSLAMALSPMWTNMTI